MACQKIGELSKDIELFTAVVYKNKRINVVPSYVYLAILLHWLSAADAAGTAREATGWKAFGSITAFLRCVPFLSFFRTLAVAESTTGGAFLYGAELWGAFISLMSSAKKERGKKGKGTKKTTS